MICSRIDFSSYRKLCRVNSLTMSSGPPPGINLNADIKQTVISPVIALMVLSAASVALRIIAKLSMKAKLQLDDYFLFAALVCTSSRWAAVWKLKLLIR